MAGIPQVLSREEFERKRSALRSLESAGTWRLALVSVGLGLAQLVLIRWAGANLARAPRLWLEGGVFLAYMALVLGLIGRMLARFRDERIRCPSCRARLEAMSERIAAATGRCDTCGGQVVETDPSEARFPRGEARRIGEP